MLTHITNPPAVSLIRSIYTQRLLKMCRHIFSPNNNPKAFHDHE
jgi:hypothetical protein